MAGKFAVTIDRRSLSFLLVTSFKTYCHNMTIIRPPNMTIRWPEMGHLREIKWNCNIFYEKSQVIIYVTFCL